jgi:hypothetical protein
LSKSGGENRHLATLGHLPVQRLAAAVRVAIAITLSQKYFRNVYKRLIILLFGNRKLDSIQNRALLLKHDPQWEWSRRS